MGGTANTSTPTYGVVPTANNVNEGSALTFNVTTTNVVRCYYIVLDCYKCSRL